MTTKPPRKNHHIRVGGRFQTPSGKRGTVLGSAQGHYYPVKWDDGTKGKVADSWLRAIPLSHADQMPRPRVAYANPNASGPTVYRLTTPAHAADRGVRKTLPVEARKALRGQWHLVSGWGVWSMQGWPTGEAAVKAGEQWRARGITIRSDGSSTKGRRNPARRRNYSGHPVDQAAAALLRSGAAIDAGTDMARRAGAHKGRAYYDVQGVRGHARFEDPSDAALVLAKRVGGIAAAEALADAAGRTERRQAVANPRRRRNSAASDVAAGLVAPFRPRMKLRKRVQTASRAVAALPHLGRDASTYLWGPQKRTNPRKPRKGSPEWRSYQLGAAAKHAEDTGNMTAFDRAEDEHERLVAASRTPELRQRHRDAWIAGRWTANPQSRRRNPRQRNSAILQSFRMLAAGLDLSDAEDRAIYRQSVFDHLANCSLWGIKEYAIAAGSVRPPNNRSGALRALANALIASMPAKRNPRRRNSARLRSIVFDADGRLRSAQAQAEHERNDQVVDLVEQARTFTRAAYSPAGLPSRFQANPRKRNPPTTREMYLHHARDAEEAIEKGHWQSATDLVKDARKYARQGHPAKWAQDALSEVAFLSVLIRQHKKRRNPARRRRSRRGRS